MPGTTPPPPSGIQEIENLWIPIGPGLRLAARAWLPAAAAQDPVPALIEVIPYRKRDGTRERDEALHRHFAGHGYAALRIDVRGSGDSDGLLLDEYLEQELLDSLAAVEWIAAQPWCNGRVAAIGKSWGGFHALQLAARRPPALGAVIAVCAADDRYADDAHYMGGCLLNENQTWGSSLFTLSALPPDPDLVGEAWRAMWLERMEHARPFPGPWLHHPLRDDYWRHGSVCEDYSRIEVPVFAVGGWADAYTNAVPRLARHLRCPFRGLIGPWGHQYPHQGRPGPAIDFPQEAVRWLDHWLRDRDTGIGREPRMHLWMPDTGPTDRPDPAGGRWIGADRWPGAQTSTRSHSLRDAQLAPGLLGAGVRDCASPPGTGSASGSWCAFGFPDELPPDQAEDDLRSLCYDSPPLAERLELLGAPVLEVQVESDQPVAFLVARLTDLSPDGSSTRISFGCLNLTHRHGHESVVAMPEGTPQRVRLQLNDAAWTLHPGHRLRLALSTSYWPLLWPSPRPARLRIHGRGSRLSVPVLDPSPGGRAWSPAPPRDSRGAAGTAQRPGRSRRTLAHDPGTGRSVLTLHTDLEDDDRPHLTRIESLGLTTGHGLVERFEIDDRDPQSARVEIVHTVHFERGSWRVRVQTETELTSDETRFLLRSSLRAWEGDDALVFQRHWREGIPRRGV